MLTELEGFCNQQFFLQFVRKNVLYLFQGAAKSVNTNSESRVFWLSLVVSEVFWVVFVFAALLTLSFKWFVSKTCCLLISVNATTVDH
jgi:hypothetical protein